MMDASMPVPPTHDGNDAPVAADGELHARRVTLRFRSQRADRGGRPSNTARSGGALPYRPEWTPSLATAAVVDRTVPGVAAAGTSLEHT